MMVDSTSLPCLSRLLKILTLLRSVPANQRIGRQFLADECGCDVRTIQRDIDLLIQADVPIAYDHSRRTYRLGDAGWTYPISETTAEDVLALALARAALSPPGLPFASSVRRAIDKTSSSLPPGLKELMARAREVIQAGSPTRDYSAAPIDLLTLACAERRTVEIDYKSFSSGERRWRWVDPYQIKQRDGAVWELHGWCHRRRQIRTFGLDRIQAARMTEDVFARREEEWERFQSETGVYGGLRGGKRVDVRVRFSPEVADHARHFLWPEGLAAEVGADGAVMLTGEVLGTDSVITDILRWRRHAEVLGGSELRRLFIEELHIMTHIYDGKSE